MGAPDLRPGDVVTTGTWTDAWPVTPGETWTAQFDAPLPVAILSAGLLNSVLFTPSEGRGRIAAIARGWAMGEKAKLLVGQDWTKYMAMPLESVRAELGVVVDPAEDATKQALAKVHARAVGTPEELRAAA